MDTFLEITARSVYLMISCASIPMYNTIHHNIAIVRLSATCSLIISASFCFVVFFFFFNVYLICLLYQNRGVDFLIDRIYILDIEI